MEKSNRKMPIILRVGIIFICLWLISFHLVGRLYARYTTTATGNDNAIAAKFSVTGTNQLPLSIDIAPGEKTDIYQIEIINDGDVAVRYSITVESVYNNIPLTIFFENEVKSEISVDINPGETKTLEMQLYWDEADNSYEYVGVVDQFYLSFTAEQIR